MMKKVIGMSALLGLFASVGLLLSERPAAACAAPVYTDPDHCHCIAKDWGYWLCATTGGGCAVVGACGDGGTIVPA